MPSLYKSIVLVLLLVLSQLTFGQTLFKGKIIDAVTKEPIQGASVNCSQCKKGCMSNASGEFEMQCTQNCCRKAAISYVGYAGAEINIGQQEVTVSLLPSASLLHEVVISANREGVKRSEAPIAISSLNTKTIQDAKPITLDQVLNKVSGVNMVSLGNEQHQMSIRQPMTTKSLFLYLEDGIPIRTTGLFNHNALLEMNMANAKSMEVIKGPSSSLYGSEAIGGVVNVICLAPTAEPVAKLSAQGNNIGYKRADVQTSFIKGKWGVVVSGYYADKRNSFLEYTDYHKGIITGRIDYRFSAKTALSNSVTAMNYYSDMPGGVDSAMFASRTFKNPQTFTYRKVNTVRYHSTLTQVWNNHSKTTASIVYRNNTIGQNPNYRIKDDYHRQGAIWAGDKTLAHGEINSSSFRSYAFIGQHKQNFAWKKSILVGGLSVDISPSQYNARYIRIQKDTITKKYVGYQPTDSLLTHYNTAINNYAAFANFEFSPAEKLRVVASLRYDLFHYRFNNYLTPSAYSGSPDTVNNFKRLSPKIGATYNFSARTGLYANYSEGFVPPQVTDMYTGVSVPSLRSSVFYNYEIGGWFEIVKNKLSADVSAYRLTGTNEIISVRMDDGSYQNQNAGKTSHKGIELGLNAAPVNGLSFRFSGAYSQHRFVDYTEKGQAYNGNEMNDAPRWLYNTEAWYKPAFVKGLRLGAEVQHIGSYYMDPQNTVKYKGYNVLNLRAGYQLNGVEIWANLLNATDNYYAYIASKSAFGYSYTLAEPRNLTVGVSYNFANLFKTRP